MAFQRSRYTDFNDPYSASKRFSKFFSGFRTFQDFFPVFFRWNSVFLRWNLGLDNYRTLCYTNIIEN